MPRERHVALKSTLVRDSISVGIASKRNVPLLITNYFDKHKHRQTASFVQLLCLPGAIFPAKKPFQISIKSETDRAIKFEQIDGLLVHYALVYSDLLLPSSPAAFASLLDCQHLVGNRPATAGNATGILGELG